MTISKTVIIVDESASEFLVMERAEIIIGIDILWKIGFNEIRVLIRA